MQVVCPHWSVLETRQCELPREFEESRLTAEVQALAAMLKTAITRERRAAWCLCCGAPFAEWRYLAGPSGQESATINYARERWRRHEALESAPPQAGGMQ